MPKKSKLAEETPEVKEKPQLEELLEEKETIQAEEDKKLAVLEEEAIKDAETPVVEVDLNEEREKTKKEVLDSVTKDVVEPLKQEIGELRKALAPEQRDEYVEYVEKYKEAHGDVPEWRILAQFTKDLAVKEVEDRQKTQQEEAQRVQQDTQKAQEDQAAQNWRTWQGQLEEMEKAEMLPKMEKPEEGDPGFDARVQLFGKMQESWKSGAPMMNLYEVHAKHYTPSTGKQPAGADAPVSLGNGSAAGDDQTYTYNDIHGKDIETMILEEQKRAQQG